VPTPAPPADLVDSLATICLALPDAYEEPAWVGTRWRVRGRTFAHVLVVDAGRPAAHARVIGQDGPVTIVAFRSAGPELEALRGAGPPFFAPPWRQDEVVWALDGEPDLGELAELLTESYCVQAPAKLVALVDRPDPPD